MTSPRARDLFPRPPRTLLGYALEDRIRPALYRTLVTEGWSGPNDWIRIHSSGYRMTRQTAKNMAARKRRLFPGKSFRVVPIYERDRW